MVDRGIIFPLSISIAVHCTAIGVGVWHGGSAIGPRIAVEAGTGQDIGLIVVESDPSAEVAVTPALPTLEVAEAIPDQPFSFTQVEMNFPDEGALTSATGELRQPTSDSGESQNWIGPFQRDGISAPGLRRSSPANVPVPAQASGGGGDGLAAIGSPMPLSRNKPPAYPAEAKRRGYEGVVLLHIDVLEDGKVASVKVASSCGFPILDEAAVEAVQKWVFDPAKVGGVPQRCQIDLPVRFVLKQ